jgi:hypothetical protein
VHPVAEQSANDIPSGVATGDAERFFRAERREKLKSTGTFLAKNKPRASKRIPTGKLSSTVRTALYNIAKQARLRGQEPFTAFAVKGAATTKGRNSKTAYPPLRYFVAIGTPEERRPVKKVKRGVAVVAKELNGRIVGYRIYHQR